MLYKNLVLVMIFILLMFSIHFIKTKPTPLREGFFDKIGKAFDDIGSGGNVIDAVACIFDDCDDEEDLYIPPRTYGEIWNGVKYGRLYSGVDITSKGYFDKQKSKTKDFRGKYRWTCLDGRIPVRIHPYNEHILEIHPAGTKICKGYAGIMYDKNAPDGPDRSDTEREYDSHTANMTDPFWGRIGSLNDGYGKEPITNKDGKFQRLNKYYDNSNNTGKVQLLSQEWEYWYEYANNNDRKNKINAKKVVLRRGSIKESLDIPETVKELNNIYGIYCANHLPKDSFFYTKYGIGTSDEWPDDAMITTFNCDAGPFPPKTLKTDIFKKSNYVNNKTGKPIHENVKRYDKSGPRKNLVKECEKNYKGGKANNCRNPALWESRCKSIKNICEKSLDILLDDNTDLRMKTELCKDNPNNPICKIEHESCSKDGKTNDDIYCEDLLDNNINSTSAYDKSNPKSTSYWNKDIYSNLSRYNTPVLSEDELARMGGRGIAGRGKGNYDRTKEDLYFKNKEIYGPFDDFAELAAGKGTLG